MPILGVPTDRLPTGSPYPTSPVEPAAGAEAGVRHPPSSPGPTALCAARRLAAHDGATRAVKRSGVDGFGCRLQSSTSRDPGTPPPAGPAASAPARRPTASQSVPTPLGRRGRPCRRRSPRPRRPDAGRPRPAASATGRRRARGRSSPPARSAGASPPPRSPLGAPRVRPSRRWRCRTTWRSSLPNLATTKWPLYASGVLAIATLSPSCSPLCDMLSPRTVSRQVRPRPEPGGDGGGHPLDDVRPADDRGHRGHFGHKLHERHGLVGHVDPPRILPRSLMWLRGSASKRQSRGRAASRIVASRVVGPLGVPLRITADCHRNPKRAAQLLGAIDRRPVSPPQ